MDKDEAIRRLLESCEELMDIVSDLKEENVFLVDTIVNANLGNFAKERRTLQFQMSQVEADAKEALREADSTKKEYEQKLKKVTALLEELELKQDNINIHIKREAERMVSNIKTEYHARIVDNNKILEKQKSENDEELREKLTQFNIKNKKYAMVSVGCVLFGVFCLIFAFT